MALRLHIGTHDAEGTHGLAILGEEARNNGMIGLFARQEVIVALRVQTEAGGAAVQIEAVAGQHNAASKILVVALDEGHHVALVISRVEVHGATAEGCARHRVQGLFAN